jgi:hypothetical protein
MEREPSLLEMNDTRYQIPFLHFLVRLHIFTSGVEIHSLREMILVYIYILHLAASSVMSIDRHRDE